MDRSDRYGRPTGATRRDTLSRAPAPENHPDRSMFCRPRPAPHLAPVAALMRRGTVADAVAADHDDLEVLARRIRSGSARIMIWKPRYGSRSRDT